MNDILLDPPPAPSPEPKKTTSETKKQFAVIMFLLAAIALLLGIILASANKSTAPAVTTTEAPVITAAPAPVINKYDAYLEHVYNNSGQANTISKADLIQYGDNICHSLDAGKTIGWIVNYLSNASNGQSDNELFASVVYGAITYLCDEYKGDLNLYLSGN